MKKIVLLFSCLMTFVSMIYAQTSAPEITRISVNEKGEVELEWTPNTYANDFDHSEVWYKSQYQPEWQKINGSESTSPDSYYFKHNAAQANTRKTFYHIKNYNYVLDEFQSTEVSPIYLKACFDQQEGGINVSWEPFALNTSEEFYVYRRKTGESWELIKTQKELLYKDPVYTDDEYSYCVSHKPMDDPKASLSNVTDPISRNDYHPKSPLISSLLIHTDGHLSLEWEKSPSNNVDYYEIYFEKSTGGWEFTGKTLSPDERVWKDNTPYEFCDLLRKYSVMAHSVCEQRSTDYPLYAKSNVLFSPIVYNSCDSIALLSWMMYTDMEVDAYEIYASYDSLKSFVMIDEVGPEVFSYTYKATVPQTCYFQIYAVHYSDDSKKEVATSCVRNVDFIFSERPNPAYFRYASVKGEDIEICFEVDSRKPHLRYVLERASSADGAFKTIVDTTNIATSTFCHTDVSMNVQNVSYHYQLKTIDTCGVTISAVKPVQSILLKADMNADRTAQLEWTSYDGFVNGLEGYIVYRYVNGELNREFPPININFYTDVDPVVSDITLNIEYLVEAVSIVNENETAEPDEALSNRAKLKLNQSDVITFPNAFAPLGSNNIFKPTIDPAINMSVYRLLIYNRWGELIFETNLQRDGWDGRIKGKMAPTGGYTYYLRIVTDTEDSYERRGSFILIN